MFICKFCQRDCKSPGGLASHIKHCKSNPNGVRKQIHPNTIKALHKRKGSRGGNTWIKLTDQQKKEAREKCRETVRKKREIDPNFGKIPKEKQESWKQKISRTMKSRKCGGYRQGSGRGKKGWYKGIFCDSSYELAYLIYCLDHNIKIQRNTEKFEYIFNNEKHLYLPDFIVEGEFVEIKGYYTEQVKAKIEQFPFEIKVLFEKDLKPVFTYVKEKYGKDFIKLYEKRDKE